MDKGLQVTRFGIMSFIGIAGMILLRDILFNMAALLFFVSTFILIVVLIVPFGKTGRHIIRRRI